MTSAYKSMLQMAEKINQLEMLYDQKCEIEPPDDVIFPIPTFFKQKGIADTYDDTMENISLFLRIIKGETINDEIDNELTEAFVYDIPNINANHTQTRLEHIMEGNTEELQLFIHEIPNMDNKPRMRFHQVVDPYINWLKSF